MREQVGIFISISRDHLHWKEVSPPGGWPPNIILPGGFQSPWLGQGYIVRLEERRYCLIRLNDWARDRERSSHE